MFPNPQNGANLRWGTLEQILPAWTFVITETNKSQFYANFYCFNLLQVNDSFYIIVSQHTATVSTNVIFNWNGFKSDWLKQQLIIPSSKSSVKPVAWVWFTTGCFFSITRSISEMLGIILASALEISCSIWEKKTVTQVFANKYVKLCLVCNAWR